MRTTFLNLILLFVIVGCKQPTIKKFQQAVEAQAKLLVDSGLIANEYVVLYELAINDSNHIYSIQAADCPADLKFEYPSKIIKYKDKYLCFIELYFKYNFCVLKIAFRLLINFIYVFLP